MALVLLSCDWDAGKHSVCFSTKACLVEMCLFVDVVYYDRFSMLSVEMIGCLRFGDIDWLDGLFLANIQSFLMIWSYKQGSVKWTFLLEFL